MSPHSRNKTLIWVTGLGATALVGVFVAFAVAAGSVRAAPTSASTVPSAVTDNLRELNNKLARTISGWQDRSLREGERFDRTLKDLEATKLRAVRDFPSTFGLPYEEAFVQLSCIDERLFAAAELSRLHEHGYVSNFPRAGDIYVRQRILLYLQDAKRCKDTLEGQLAAAQSTVPLSATDNLRELNNKLARTISGWQDRSLREGERFDRTLKDLEATKLRAVRDFPSTFGLPYEEAFVQLSCIDERLFAAAELSRLHEHGYVSNFPRAGDIYVRQRILLYLQDTKRCKDAFEVALQTSSGATSPPTTTTTTLSPTTTTPPTKPSSGGSVYRGPIGNGVFLADGNGSHIKLTVDSRRVRVTFGTNFRYVCQGNQTLHVTGKWTQVNLFDFHPGWAWHPISPTGGFSITLFHHVLAGQFVSPTTVRGTFTFEGVIEASDPTPTECHGNHSWTATLGGKPPASIGPIVVMVHHVGGPVGKGEATRRDALFQDYLQRQGYVQDASNPNRAGDASTGKSAVWNRDLETWDDAKTGQHLSGSGNDPAVLAYVFWQLDLSQKGFARSDPYHASNSSTGERAVFDLKKLQWVDAKTGAPLSRAGR